MLMNKRIWDDVDLNADDCPFCGMNNVRTNSITAFLKEKTITMGLDGVIKESDSVIRELPNQGDSENIDIALSHNCEGGCEYIQYRLFHKGCLFPIFVLKHQVNYPGGPYENYNVMKSSKLKYFRGSMNHIYVPSDEPLIGEIKK